MAQRDLPHGDLFSEPSTSGNSLHSYFLVEVEAEGWGNVRGYLDRWAGAVWGLFLRENPDTVLTGLEVRGWPASPVWDRPLVLVDNEGERFRVHRPKDVRGGPGQTHPPSAADYYEPFMYTYCRDDDPGVGIRGAKNAPRPGGDDTAGPPPGADLGRRTDPTPRGRFTIPTPYGGPVLPIEPPH